MLSLVFVQTLYLNVEDTVCVENDTAFSLDILRKVLLVLLLYVKKFCKESLVVLVSLECGKLCAVLDELRADSLGEEFREVGVRLIEPSSVCNAVCYVLELLGSEAVLIVEYRVLDDLGVEL